MTLCILAGTTPIILRTEEAVRQYNLSKRKGDSTTLVDLEVEPKNWSHPADIASVNEVTDYDDKNVKLFTDRSKSEQDVGAGVAIFRGTELVTQRKYRLDNRCSNNKAEQFAIVKALEVVESLNIDDSSQRTAAVITASRVALDSVKNAKNHSFLIEEIRPMLSKLERSNWTIVFSWVKDHVGIKGNELVDQIANAAARDNENSTTYNRIPKSTLYKELEEENIIKWQKAWEGSPKAAVTEQFFPKHFRQDQD
jgi:ribonuclease HI